MTNYAHVLSIGSREQYPLVQVVQPGYRILDHREEIVNNRVKPWTHSSKILALPSWSIRGCTSYLRLYDNTHRP